MSKLKGRYVVLGDLNGHVGRDVEGYEGVHGGNGLEIGMQKVKPFLNLPCALALLLQTHFS